MKRLFNQFLSLIEIALQRTWAARGSHAAIALGVLVATTTICALILYADSVNIEVLRDRLAQAHDAATYDMLIKGESNLMDGRRYQDMNDLITTQMRDRVGLPLTQVGRHGWSKPLRIILPGQSPVGRRDELPRTRFQFYAGVEDQIEVVQGHFPQPVSDPQDVVEVMVTEKLADKLGLKVGDVFQVEDFTGGAQPMQVQARLAAIIRLRDAKSGFWFYAPWFLDEALTIPEQSFFRSIVLNFVPAGAEVTWAANYDETVIDSTNVYQVIAGLGVLRFNLTSRLANLQFLTELDKVLNDYRRGTFMLRALLVVLGAPVIGIALYYIMMSAHLLVEHQRAEIAVLKSRGGGNGQVLALFLVQGVLIVGLATLLAPWLAWPLAQLIGRATTFMVFSNGRLLPATVEPSLYQYAALAAVLALIAIMGPTLRAARQTIVTYRREAARDERPPLVHRYYLDLVLLLAGGWGYRTLSQSGTIITRNATGGLEFDRLLLLTPIALTIALAFLALRLVPLAMRGLARLIALTDTVAPLFALRQVARAPARYNGLILILTFTLALGLFTATVAGAFDRNYGDQALYVAGADLRTHEFNYQTVRWQVRPLNEYRALPGVAGVTPVLRVDLVGRQAQILAKGTLLVVDLDTFADVAWWRPDFTPPLADLLGQLRGNEKAVLADGRFIASNRLKVGDTFDIDVDGSRVDFVLAGTLGDYFPTLYPDKGSRLLARLDYLNGLLGAEPSEIWLRTQPWQHQQAVAALHRQEANSKSKVIVYDGHELAGVRKEDPFRTGLFGALSLGFVAASGLSVLGFLLYAYMSIQVRALQFGVLRASGLSVQQLIAALAIEQLSLIGVGILLGTALGGGAGWMFTRFLQISIIARESIPPFLVVTPWDLILQLYLILIVIFGAALAVSVYLLRKMQVHAVLRLGEQ
jgi:putative ABC transport system permease protein